MKKTPLNFDIDHYINPLIPYNRLHLLPKPITWFLGYRENNRKAIGSLVVVWWSFIGAFIGMLVVEAVYMTHGLQSDGAPIVIASLVSCSFPCNVPSDIPTNILTVQLGCCSNPRIQYN